MTTSYPYQHPTPARRSRKLVAILLVLVAILLVLVGIFGWKQYDYRFGSAIARSGAVNVPTGTSFGELSRMLVDSGYVRNGRKWMSYARAFDRDTVRPGHYALQKGETYRAALSAFSFGRQTPVRLTFNNIRTMDRLAGVVAKYIEADSATILQTLSDPAVIAETGLTRATFPSLFIPNTYEVYWTMTPREFVARMQKEHDRFWNDDRRARAAELGYTPEQIATIASIVAEETNFRGEMTQVAGVYINRLRKGILLQADPTVKFAVGDPTIRRVLHKHLAFDSPYNTYKYAGLPPGPICVPSIAALDATLAYADRENRHDYYYFCAKSDFSGRHAFARTLPEHSRNAAAYAAELNRRGIR
ncbi:endolytic transglycosylase MltG [uncultured Rikenella sp.]|uniref:endolytic transglycosylase MltG n=1 Tax=uncultured Rikenella sp. TaxID=368003 RepID=UPI00262F3A88|nr:endolytic transglycosylase MltG [uncultured Rikenella sp.]